MSNVYRIAMTLTANNHAGGVLAALASQLLHVHGLVNQTNMAMGRFRTALGGAAGIFAGSKMVEGYADLVEHGAKFLHIQNQMIAQGWKHAEVSEAVRRSWELTAKYKTVDVDQILEMQKEMAPVLGSRHEAGLLAETMAKLSVSMLGTLGVDGEGQFNKQIRDAIKSGELSGNVLQPERFEKYLDGMAKTIKAFGGTVMPSDYFMATKYGRASAMNWDDSFTNNILPSIIQELGASSTGTALMSMYQAIVAGTMKQKAISAWNDIGMINHNKLNPEDLTPEGRIKRLEPGAFVGAQDFMSNPMEWMWGDNGVVAHLVSHGKLTQHQVDLIKAGDIKEGEGAQARKDLTEYLALMFGNRTAQGMADVLVMQYKKIMREADLRDQAMGLDEGARFYGDQDLIMAQVAWNKQMEDFKTALGAPEVNTATRMLHRLTDMITLLGQTAAQHPMLTSALMSGVLVSGITLIIGGIAALATAVVGTSGLIAAGILGIIAGVAMLWQMDWKGIASKTKQGFKDVTTWLFGADEYIDKNGGYHSRIKGIFARIGSAISEAIAAIPGMVMGAISAMGAALAAAIKGVINGVVGGIGGFFSGEGSDTNRSGRNGLGLKKNMNYVPPSGGQPIITKATFNLDGRRVGEGIVKHMIDASQFQQSAANFDGMAAPTSGDFSFT